ncbi:hypothetical protein ACVWYN_000434 [Pedobacter sp. UYP24]
MAINSFPLETTLVKQTLHLFGDLLKFAAEIMATVLNQMILIRHYISTGVPYKGDPRRYVFEII